MTSALARILSPPCACCPFGAPVLDSSGAITNHKSSDNNTRDKRARIRVRPLRKHRVRARPFKGNSVAAVASATELQRGGGRDDESRVSARHELHMVHSWRISYLCVCCLCLSLSLFLVLERFGRCALVELEHVYLLTPTRTSQDIEFW